MSNFRFLAEEWPDIAREARDAERFVQVSPTASAVFARKALERAVRWMFENDGAFEYPYDRQLSALMNADSFRREVPPALHRELHLIRKVGNSAAHDKRIVVTQSVASIQYLFRFLKWFGRLYSVGDLEVPPFDEAHIQPKAKPKDVPTLAQLQDLQQRYDAERTRAEEERKERLKAEEERQKLQAELDQVKARKEKHAQLPLPEAPYTEQETRRQFIDEMLREAGWDPEGANVAEYPVQGMPRTSNPIGIGYVDYVLWGNDGKPLAVVEAKRTMVNAEQGKVQAGLYADCLERMTGQRPVIFYTNGFDTWIWDDRFHPPREVQGIHDQDALQLMVDRRRTREDIRRAPIDQRIVERAYQHEAIRRVAEAWVGDEQGRLVGLGRRALVVMATGAGKTRTAASLVDLLMKANWVKRALFLADRTALVTQAQRAFKEHLPQVSTLDLTKDTYEPTARVVFSTYPTMLNRVDKGMVEDMKLFGVGHFDLVIVDEAHRSIYDRYRAIFDYFDALLLGLTATPRADADRDTYELFNCEEHNPTAFYELDQAVRDGYLVPPRGKQVDLGFMSRGIKYADLQPDDQARYEKTFRDETGEVPDEVGASAINAWLFNSDTIDKALAYLMEHGVKVEGGDRLGKTIIFARNIDHARAIEKRFNKQFPQYGGHFLSVVHSQEKYAQSVIDNFSMADRNPRICVSVDMLDTGIDIPEIVNLVFFKPVYSKAKFWQMIGRGTRLCKDLFGPGADKEFFRIFDFCKNYEFFDQQPEGLGPSRPPSLSHRLLEANVMLAEALRGPAFQDADHQELRKMLLDQAHGWVHALWERRTTLLVRPIAGLLDGLKDRATWDDLGQGQVSDLVQKVGPLVEVPDQDEEAKRFDLLLRRIQLATATGEGDTTALYRRLSAIAEELSRKGSVPAVAAKMSVIRPLAGGTGALAIPVLEHIRVQLRDLVRLIEKEGRKVIHTDLRDEIEHVGEERHDIPGGYHMRNYRLKVTQFIRENRHHLTINKLHTNQPITHADLAELERMIFDGDERGTKEQLMEELGSQRPIGEFIRSILGLDANAAKEAFGAFLMQGNLMPHQIQFIDQIIEHLKVNGIIDKRMLAEKPFTDLHDQGLFGVFPKDEDQDRIISILDRVNGNASAGGAA